jgi:hypothetical protein
MYETGIHKVTETSDTLKIFKISGSHNGEYEV